MEELGDPPYFHNRSEAEYERLVAEGKRIVDELTDHDGRYSKLLAERGGRISRGFYKIRHKLDIIPGIDLISKDERSREELIRYHESRRADPKGITHYEDPDIAHGPIDSRRPLR